MREKPNSIFTSTACFLKEEEQKYLMKMNVRQPRDNLRPYIKTFLAKDNHTS
jgi:hypothetical protein